MPLVPLIKIPFNQLNPAQQAARLQRCISVLCGDADDDSTPTLLTYYYFNPASEIFANEKVMNCKPSLDTVVREILYVINNPVVAELINYQLNP